MSGERLTLCSGICNTDILIKIMVILTVMTNSDVCMGALLRVRQSQLSKKESDGVYCDWGGLIWIGWRVFILTVMPTLMRCAY